MAVRTERSDKWVRALVADVAVVDSRAPVLFWESGFPVPAYAFDRADVRTELLRPSTTPPPREPWFFLPQGPVGQWYDLEVDGDTRRHAAWTRDTPELTDLVVLSWQPGVLDRWLEEDEEVAGHPRDPHKRVEALASSRHVRVASAGVVLADSTDPVLLFETDLPTRFYLPRADVDLTALSPTDNQSRCPYKGVTDQYWDVTGSLGISNAAWSYDEPYPAVQQIAHRVAFYDELLDVTVDGVPQERPVSPFSNRSHRPGS